MLNTLQPSCNYVVEVLATHSTTYCNYVFEKKNFIKYTLPDSGHSAKPNLHSAKALPSAALGKEHSAKKESAKTSLPSVFCRALGKAFAECRHSAKLEPKKKPKKMGIFTQKKWKFFLIGGGPHRSAPIHLRLFSRKFHGYAADGIRTQDLSLRTNLLYHYTTLSLVSRFRFSSQYIILNRV